MVKIFGASSSVAYKTDIIVNTNRITLGSVSFGEVSGIANLGIAALCSSPVDINPSRSGRIRWISHIAHSPPEGDVDGIAACGACSSPPP